MVTEYALVQVRPGCGPAFEAAFAGVVGLLRSAVGYRRHRLVAAVDREGLYLLEVGWRTLEDHTAGFEPSPAHTRFMDALMPLLDGDPIVFHLPEA